MNKGEIYYISKSALDNRDSFVLAPGRPAIVVSAGNINSIQNTVCIVYLTSKPKQESPAHFVMRCKGVTSTVLCEEIVTIDKSRVGKYIDKLTDAEMSKLDNCLRYALDLSSIEEIEVENDAGLQEKITKLEKRVNLYENIIARLTEEEL
jgi:mRNA interferase MazF